MRSLGTLGGPNARAEAINDSGQVVGWSETAHGEVRAFLWSAAAGRMQDLGIPPGWSGSFASGVNERGDVVGFGWGPGETRAFFRSAATGRMHDLGAGGWPNLSALNNKGQVAGTDTRGAGRAFLRTEDGGRMDLGSLGGGASHARAINEDGHVVGASLNRNGQ
jgi:probable HAF family extracellular repeat protein